MVASINVQRLIPPLMIFLLIFFLIAMAIDEAGAQSDQVKIGVLAHKGYDHCLQSWTPTADFLTAEISDTEFKIVPLKFEEINPSVQDGKVDFIIANSSIYVELEMKYWVTAIATMQNQALNNGVTVFGGVIFFPKSGASINRLQDLRGKRFVAVDETSLGGWRMAWREMAEVGIDPHKDFKELLFSKSHRLTVKMVKDGVADAGTVRTDTLERMAENGSISLNEFSVLPYHGKSPDYVNFPFLLSTRLYPEWPMAKLMHVVPELAKKVAAALLRMRSDSKAAHSAAIAGWTIPLSYQPVHDLLKELKLGPYEYLGKVTFEQVIEQYWHVLTAAVLFLIKIKSTTPLNDPKMEIRMKVIFAMEF